MVILPLSTGEALRVVLGPETARALLESLLQHPHLRTVAAMLRQTPEPSPVADDDAAREDAGATCLPGEAGVPGGHRGRRPRPSLRLVAARPREIAADKDRLLDQAQESLARSRRLIEQIRAGLQRRDSQAIEAPARDLCALLRPIGADVAREAAQRLEEATARGDTASTAAAVNAIEEALARLGIARS